MFLLAQKVCEHVLIGLEQKLMQITDMLTKCKQKMTGSKID